MILEQFDSSKKAVINPEEWVKKVEGFPEVCVSCFNHVLMEKIINVYSARKIAQISNTNMEVPIYEIEYEGTKIAICMAPVGGAACVGQFEEVRALGMKKLVIFGTCGVLDKGISECSVVIPTSAVRDEGTSYHYVKSSEEIELNTNKKDVEIFEEILNSHSWSYAKGKTWTTDAFYRETKAKLKERKERNCVCVEMEAASVAAFAKFRELELFQFFYAADNLDNEDWEKRTLGDKTILDKEFKVVELALKFANKIG